MQQAAKSRHFGRRNGFCFGYLEQSKALAADQFGGEIIWFCENMKMNMVEMLGFCITRNVFFLTGENLMQQLYQSRLNFAQFAKLFRGELVQCFGMAFEHNHQTARALDGVGMFNQPEFPSVDGLPR